ncbi:MAG: polyhydroxyalkanoate depolymerase [Alphaproteobacteria bacterium]|nr:polyhydroxyalkanoate depolymerase [Alphaproteobacteria bacterium]
MLYHMHEMRRAAVAPLRLMAESMRRWYGNPWMPIAHTPLGRTIAAGCEMLERTTRRYPKPAFDLGEEIVWRSDFCQLLRFRRQAEGEVPRVLVVAPLSGHHATLLRDTVEGLLADHEVYVTDWLDAREIPAARGRFDLDDYIDLLRELLVFLGPRAHVLAVCQPSVPVLACVALMAADDDPAQPASMVLMGGPIDTRVNPTKVNEMATSRTLAWFERNVIHAVPANHAGAGRRVYPGFLQLTGFMSLNVDRHVDAHVKMFGHLVEGDGDSAERHRAFYDEYMSVMDLPAEYYLQTIQTVFQEHALPRGAMTHQGRAIDPGAIRRTALMTVEGERDDISGPGQTKAAHDLCTGLPEGMRRHHLQAGVGHYGIFNGRRWREEILPNVRDFIRTHDAVLGTEDPAPDVPGRMGILMRRLRALLPS